MGGGSETERIQHISGREGKENTGRRTVNKDGAGTGENEEVGARGHLLQETLRILYFLLRLVESHLQLIFKQKSSMIRFAF